MLEDDMYLSNDQKQRRNLYRRKFKLEIQSGDDRDLNDGNDSELDTDYGGSPKTVASRASRTRDSRTIMARPTPVLTESTNPTFLPITTSPTRNLTSLTFTPLQTPSPAGF